MAPMPLFRATAVDDVLESIGVHWPYSAYLQLYSPRSVILEHAKDLGILRQAAQPLAVDRENPILGSAQLRMTNALRIH